MEYRHRAPKPPEWPGRNGGAPTWAWATLLIWLVLIALSLASCARVDPQLEARRLERLSRWVVAARETLCPFGTGFALPQLCSNHSPPESSEEAIQRLEDGWARLCQPPPPERVKECGWLRMDLDLEAQARGIGNGS